MSIPGAAPDWTPVRLARRRQLAHDIHLLELRAHESGELAGFSAGAHISVRAPNGLVRKYSLCNDPGERERYVIAVKREAGGRGGSISLADEAREGDEILASAPLNNFALAKSPAGYVFIAGGIGIAPIMSM